MKSILRLSTLIKVLIQIEVNNLGNRITDSQTFQNTRTIITMNTNNSSSNYMSQRVACPKVSNMMAQRKLMIRVEFREAPLL